MLYNKEYKRRHPISLIHIIRSDCPRCFFPTHPCLLMLNTKPNPKEIHKNKQSTLSIANWYMPHSVPARLR